MRAAWYQRGGPAHQVLQLGQMKVPAPKAGEVRVRIAWSAVNPYDVKKRANGRELPTFSRIVPHCDGSGIIEAVGTGVPNERVGERVWLLGAQAHQAQGTPAQHCVLPEWKAVPLPAAASFADGACLGIPAVTAHRALFADGPIADSHVLVIGATGRVGAYAVQLARHAGASVIATSRSPEASDELRALGAEHVLSLRDPEFAARVGEITGGHGVDRIVESAFGRNIDSDARVLADDGVIAAYGFDDDPQPKVPCLRLTARNAVCRFIGIFSMRRSEQVRAFEHINACLEQGVLQHRVGRRFGFEDIAAAHDAIEVGRVYGAALVAIGEAAEA
ncbi:MAG: NADPH:quinone reductase [Burkholderiales bacterium]|nr:MAG: NADPH:quinone reductase [Burkholderiales bacterium]